MINFICKVFWTTGYPDISSNIILGISVSMLLLDIEIEISEV